MHACQRQAASTMARSQSSPPPLQPSTISIRLADGGRCAHPVSKLVHYYRGMSKLGLTSGGPYVTCPQREVVTADPGQAVVADTGHGGAIRADTA